MIMQLSETGNIEKKYWHEIPAHFPFVELDSFVVMPNHIHGIIIINKPGDEIKKNGDSDNIVSIVVETRHALSLPSHESHKSQKPHQTNETNETYIINDPPNTQISNKTIGQQRFQNQGKNTLSSIIGSYKSAVTKNARKINPDFAWQGRFHDHIIRHEKSYHNIANYITNNPLNWNSDEFHRTVG